VRVNIDKTAVHRIVDQGAGSGMERTAKFMADNQRATTTSRRVRAQVDHESGKDMGGWYARAGMKDGTRTSPGFIWYFHEYQTGKGPPGQPFLRQSLFNNTRQIARMMTGGR
jgi:hypothetical protein